MSRLLISSDLHLGHKNAHKFRTQFKSAEEHHEFVFEQLALSVGKRDSIMLLGDVAFDAKWLSKIASIKCRKKTLICGNHDTEGSISMFDIARAYDEVHSMLSKRNYWFTHCPIHNSQFRGRIANIHGHLHDVRIDDARYINACVEHTEFKPISFDDLIARHNPTEKVLLISA